MIRFIKSKTSSTQVSRVTTLSSEISALKSQRESRVNILSPAESYYIPRKKPRLQKPVSAGNTLLNSSSGFFTTQNIAYQSPRSHAYKVNHNNKSMTAINFHYQDSSFRRNVNSSFDASEVERSSHHERMSNESESHRQQIHFMTDKNSANKINLDIGDKERKESF